MRYSQPPTQPPSGGFFSPKTNKELRMTTQLESVKNKPTWDTVKTLSEAEPAFTLAAIRNLIFLSADRKTSKGIIKGNGLAPHIRRIGAKVLINREGFLGWIDSQESDSV